MTPADASTRLVNLSNWVRSSRLEWLVTNGIGGYASGTLAGASTRRYHGFLMAALDPPVGRTLLIARVEETITFSGKSIALASNQWLDGSVSPQGFERLQTFYLEDGIPVWTYLLDGFAFEKRVWMEDAANQTWARYTWPAGAPPALLSLKIFAACRDFHSQQHGSTDWHWIEQPIPTGISLRGWESAPEVCVQTSIESTFVPERQWYWGFLHDGERERGLDDREDLWVPGSIEVPLQPGTSVGLHASTGTASADASEMELAYERERRRRFGLTASTETRPAIRVLTTAADAFLVRRPTAATAIPASPNSIIAGYHWFADWGRDTMISLPGLALVTGRPGIARDILRCFATFIHQGLLPNRFPDSGAPPEYTTVDGTLWYFQAIRHYLRATGDSDLVRELFPALEGIIDWHLRGTLHGIGVDPADGLLRAGEPGLQLTWMDARVGNWVVTPRIGKPVEINALWHSALLRMAEWAADCGGKPETYATLRDKAAESFRRRFPVPDQGYLFDVVDSPDGDDRSFRPNQLLAASLENGLTPPELAASMIELIEQKLLTPAGLRTLDPADPRYRGRYTGDQGQRDGAYHQGTVWPWLIGPYVDAVVNVFQDTQRALRAVEPIRARLQEAGVGFLEEIAEGDAPHRPCGCIAQAWSVGELLRAMKRLDEAGCDCWRS